MTLEMCGGCNKPKPREWCWDGRQSGCPMGMPPRYPAQPSITCPVCLMTSYNLHDIEMGYCGNCCAYTGTVDGLMKARRFIEETRRVEQLDLCTCPGPTMTDTSCPVHGDDE